ncbi:MAG: 50S ribosomal protein L1 [Candidatus Micrarchaeia archaeon]
MNQEFLDKIITLIKENKGKRKFKQSVDLSVNFFHIDFSKQDNRINIELNLKYPKGKEQPIIIFADDPNIAGIAKSMNIEVIQSSELQKVATDKLMLNKLLKSFLLAQPSLMPQIAKSLGQFLGSRNHMPKLIVGSDLNAIIKSAMNSVSLRTKGKNLPTINCAIATETSPPEEIEANAEQVIEALEKKVGKQNIKSVYIKLTMSKPVRLI